MITGSGRLAAGTDNEPRLFHTPGQVRRRAAPRALRALCPARPSGPGTSGTGAAVCPSAPRPCPRTVRRLGDRHGGPRRPGPLRRAGHGGRHHRQPGALGPGIGLGSAAAGEAPVRNVRAAPHRTRHLERQRAGRPRLHQGGLPGGGPPPADAVRTAEDLGASRSIASKAISTAAAVTGPKSGSPSVAQRTASASLRHRRWCSASCARSAGEPYQLALDHPVATGLGRLRGDLVLNRPSGPT